MMIDNKRKTKVTSGCSQKKESKKFSVQLCMSLLLLTVHAGSRARRRGGAHQPHLSLQLPAESVGNAHEWRERERDMEVR